ncbi:NADH-quinone oxidoreductase subunit NuoN [Bacillus sp. V3B]|uniref:NADH-quinone oxidoreductase subunit NuoN n=1 Tax=Bacillus sp. V3B TaxID=2804915 RepID=UPI00210CD50F|nr:NADH-quinone oxidoreductase subunit NuoN [Bacillus sp. V3B]MCQ6274632.1 NADH-quinone oxidoreductase subunit NuoN [Bacillus sp. V3B]
MDLETLLSFEWGIMMPEFIILGVATVMTLLDLFMPKGLKRKILGWIGFAGILAAIVSLIGLLDYPVTTILFDTFRLDSFAKAFKLILLVGAALVMLLAISYEPKEGLTEYRSEFFYLFLTALLGAMIVTSSGDLITLYVGLELLSLSSYILAGLRKENRRSNEAAMKYVVNGSISTAITLFGVSYVYGLTGTTNIAAMREILLALNDSQSVYLLVISFLMIFVGLSFKIAAAPFHMWAPDVYEGAPTPVTAFLSVVSKIAGFVLLVRVMLSIFANAVTDGPNSTSILLTMEDTIAFIAGVTMVVGNVVALQQKNMKRLFAYSSIAHAGYILVAIASLSLFMFDSLWFYLIAYLFMNLGAFAIIQTLTEKSDSEDSSHFSGLYTRAPILAVAMAVMILSLAGIPGTAGFIGKLNIITGALVREQANYVLVSVMIATTVISYVFYFGIMVQMFFRKAKVKDPIKIPVGTGIVIGVCAVATVLLGIFPNIAFDFLQAQFYEFGDFLR